MRSWLDLTGANGAKPRLQQIMEMLRLAGASRFSPGEYWLYGFHKKEIGSREMLQYLASREHFDRHLPELTPSVAVPLLENKWFFHLHCAALGIAVPRFLGLYSSTYGFSAQNEPLRNAAQLKTLVRSQDGSPFIAKPVTGSQGRAIRSFSVIRNAGEDALQLAGSEISFEDAVGLFDSDGSKERSSGILLQERLTQDAVLAEISPTAPANLRIITLRLPNGAVEITSASMRIGRVGAAMSNASQGGILATIHPGRGEIGIGRSGLTFEAPFLEVHPDTGVRFSGVLIPRWDEIVRLCKHAASTIPDASSIGWDVILTSTRPILLEANHDWDVISEQLFGSGYLAGKTRALLQECGLSFPSDTFPKFHLKNVTRFLHW